MEGVSDARRQALSGVHGTDEEASLQQRVQGDGGEPQSLASGRSFGQSNEHARCLWTVRQDEGGFLSGQQQRRHSLEQTLRAVPSSRSCAYSLGISWSRGRTRFLAGQQCAEKSRNSG